MKKPTFIVYQDHAGGWRWRLQHRNGRIIADSGDGYMRKRDAMRAVDTVLQAIFDADIRVAP